MMCVPWRGEEINNSDTRKIKTAKWSENPKSQENTLIGISPSYFALMDFF